MGRKISTIGDGLLKESGGEIDIGRSDGEIEVLYLEESKS
jgi:hypothetical protein